MQSVDYFLRKCVEMDGSDLHFKSDTGKAYVRVHGDLIEVEAPRFTSEEFRRALYGILKQPQIDRFEKQLELDFSHEVVGVSRFRGNAYQQRGNVQAAFRVIPYEILTMEDLFLPAACYDFINRPRGLVLVTGPAGSGKSTSLAALLDRINQTQPLHIVTVEDPIEFVHGDHVALINQRELEVDTMSFTNALKFVLRQDPDVILVGEMRDLETIHLAISAAETGHLVFGTLHTIDAVQTVDRIIDVFPTHQQQQIRMQLSVNLVGVLSQTLVRRKDNRGRIAAHEVLVCTGAVRNMIRENKSYQIGSIIQTGSKLKMQSLDQSLARLVQRGLVEREDARVKAKDPMEFERLIGDGDFRPQAGQSSSQSQEPFHAMGMTPRVSRPEPPAPAPPKPEPAAPRFVRSEQSAPAAPVEPPAAPKFVRSEQPAPAAPVEPPVTPKFVRSEPATPTTPEEPPVTPKFVRSEQSVPAAPVEPPATPKFVRSEQSAPAAPVEPPATPKFVRSEHPAPAAPVEPPVEPPVTPQPTPTKPAPTSPAPTTPIPAQSAPAEPTPTPPAQTPPTPKPAEPIRRFRRE